jgi:secondary thiamine-phosphate synthase enzyme
VHRLNVKTTKDKEVLDITDLLNDIVMKSAYEKGVCHLFMTHTTCALTTADLDAGTDEILIDSFKKLVPEKDDRHRHNPEHVGSHVLSSLIGTSLTIPIQNASLVLGTWQRVVIIEFNGPKERHIAFTFIPDKSKQL